MLQRSLYLWRDSNEIFLYRPVAEEGHYSLYVVRARARSCEATPTVKTPVAKKKRVL